MIFLQGDPYSHCKDIGNKINAILQGEYPKLGFDFLANDVLACSKNHCRYHGGLGQHIEYMWEVLEMGNDVERFQFGAGGQFIVSRDQVLKRSRKFYEKIVYILSKYVRPIQGNVIERLHSVIFSL
jgi:hypothetical protein